MGRVDAAKRRTGGDVRSVLGAGGRRTPPPCSLRELSLPMKGTVA
jgi:hypothetical protein